MSEEQDKLAQRAARIERWKRQDELKAKIPMLEKQLLENMRRDADALQQLLTQVNGRSEYENSLYRFYHHSFKVFYLQSETEKIVEALTKIAPDGQPFCEFFQAILNAGTGRKFTLEDNQHWVERTAPITLAFFHARYFLEMAVKYAAELDTPPQLLPYGWAALLELYGIRG